MSERWRAMNVALAAPELQAHLRQFGDQLDPFYSVEIPSEPKM